MHGVTFVICLEYPYSHTSRNIRLQRITLSEIPGQPQITDNYFTNNRPAANYRQFFHRHPASWKSRISLQETSDQPGVSDNSLTDTQPCAHPRLPSHRHSACTSQQKRSHKHPVSRKSATTFAQTPNQRYITDNSHAGHRSAAVHQQFSREQLTCHEPPSPLLRHPATGNGQLSHNRTSSHTSLQLSNGQPACHESTTTLSWTHGQPQFTDNSHTDYRPAASQRQVSKRHSASRKSPQTIYCKQADFDVNIYILSGM